MREPPSTGLRGEKVGSARSFKKLACVGAGSVKSNMSEQFVRGRVRAKERELFSPCLLCKSVDGSVAGTSYGVEVSGDWLFAQAVAASGRAHLFIFFSRRRR